MQKLIKGIVEFREKKQQGYCKRFGSLISGQNPDALFIACSDSRVVPNTFASTNPGDLFVLRNVGNLVPVYSPEKDGKYENSATAAIEYAVKYLQVRDIIVCGHSECGAMQALLKSPEKAPESNLANWLENGIKSIAYPYSPKVQYQSSLSPVNELSLKNILQQLEHIRSYPLVVEAMKTRSLRLHGWWFDLATANVYNYSSNGREFRLIDEKEADRILREIEEKA